MAVYVDNMQASFGRMKMCHMIADTEEELSDIAVALGLNLKWWQYRGTRKSHFDVCLSRRRKALTLGAVAISYRELGWMVKHRLSCNDKLQRLHDTCKLN